VEEIYRACLALQKWLLFKVFFAWKCIKIMFFFVFLNSFLTSVNQNDPNKKKIKQKQIQILTKNRLNRPAKHTLREGNSNI
jgi:hypothetical protein